jgi:hypothetical protein
VISEDWEFPDAGFVGSFCDTEPGAGGCPGETVSALTNRDETSEEMDTRLSRLVLRLLTNGGVKRFGRTGNGIK